MKKKLADLVTVIARVYLGIPVHISTAYLRGTEGQLPWLGALLCLGFCQKSFRKYLDWLNPYSLNVTFLYPLKTSENLGFSDVFRGYRKVTLGQYGLKCTFQLGRRSI